MKDFDYYNTIGIPYPTEQMFTTVYGYSKGECIFKMSVDDFNNMNEDEKSKAATIERQTDKVAHKAALKAHGEELGRLFTEFKTDCFKDFGIEDNPRREKAFYYAWDHGHSGGYSEVYNMMIDIVDLID